MTKLQLIAHLWSLIYDFWIYVNGQSSKSIEDLEKKMDLLEYESRRYADMDDEEITYQKN